MSVSLISVLKSLPDGSLNKDRVNTLCEVLLGKTKWSDACCERRVAESVWSLVVTAVRESWSAQTVREKLADTQGGVGDLLADAIEKHRPLLRQILKSIHWDFPQLVDVDWTVAKTAESSSLARVGAPYASFTLHSIPTDEAKSTQLTFDCDANQLQDLNWKIKEAMNAYKELQSHRD